MRSRLRAVDDRRLGPARHGRRTRSRATSPSLAARWTGSASSSAVREPGRGGGGPGRERSPMPAASIWCRHLPGSARRTGTPRREGSSAALTRGTTPAHVARATVESIAYQVRDVFDAMRADARQTPSCAPGRRRRQPERRAHAVSGRHARLSPSSATIPPTCRLAARRGSPVWPSASGRRRPRWPQLPRTVTRFEPRMAARERDARYSGWRDAVSRARGYTARQESA